ncbi:MAG: hypothetical protein K0U41_04425, partial [Gammaproteobacteria bacterium]|nr:hypothetical protein [Gammaproteobacteria bacterium]
MTNKIVAKLSCKLLVLITLGLGLVACAIPAPIENTLSSASRVVAQTAAVSTSKGTATLIWNNPTYSASNSIVSINISYVGYATATATVPTNNSAGHEIINSTTTTTSEYERLRANGGRDIMHKITNLTAANATFYEFAITLNYFDGEVQKVELGSAKRLNVQAPTPIMPITDLVVTSNMPNKASLNWTNPVYSTPNQLVIQSVNISYEGYAAFSGGSVVDGSSGYVILTRASFLRQNVNVSYDLPNNLNQTNYYEFTVTLLYRGLGVQVTKAASRTDLRGMSSIANPAPMNVEATSTTASTATVTWDNPVSTTVMIESVNISYTGYATESGGEDIDESFTFLTANGNPNLVQSGMTGRSYAVTGLEFAKYYTFTVTLNYAGAGAPASANSNRTSITLPSNAPDAINPIAVITAANEATIVWDNPGYHEKIQSINISYEGYTALNGGSVVDGSSGHAILSEANGDTALLVNRRIGRTGMRSLQAGLDQAMFYEFTVNLTYVDGNSSSISVPPGRLEVATLTSVPTLAPPTAMSTAEYSADITWSNPDPAYPVSIESVTIAYKGYDAASSGNLVSGADGSVILTAANNANLLQMGGQSYSITDLTQATHYEFTVTLTYRAMAIAPLSATTAARAKIMRPTPVPLNVGATSTTAGNATVTWDNPTSAETLMSINISYAGYAAESGGEVIDESFAFLDTSAGNPALLLSGSTGLTHVVTGLDFAQYYVFNVTLTYTAVMGIADTSSASTSRIPITLPTDVPGAINPETVVTVMDQANIIWDNPAYHLNIISVNISYVGYADAMPASPALDGSANHVILSEANGDTALLVNRRIGRAGLNYMQMDLDQAAYYEFNINLTYTDGSSNVSGNFPMGRLNVDTVEAAPTFAAPPTAASDAVDEATVTWTNPDYPVSIESVT